MRRFLPISICVLLTFCTIALSADWPGWRGPNRDGHSADEDLLKRWPTSGPPLAWQTNTCGAGWGSPIVVDGKVFLMGNGRSKEYMVALDEETGEQVWGCVIGDAKIALGFEGPRSTPTTGRSGRGDSILF